MKTKNGIAFLFVFLFCFSFCALSHGEEADRIRLGMTEEEVGVAWGIPVVKDSYNGIVQCYRQNGHTLICGFDWYDTEKGTWSVGRFSENAVWGLTEWIEFDEKNQRVCGTVPENEDVRFVMREFIALAAEEIPRAHDAGSGFFIPVKITSDGWIVEEDMGPHPIACLNQSWLDHALIAPLSLWGFIQGWTR